MINKVTYFKSTPYSNKHVLENAYDELILSELGLVNWIFLSSYSVFDTINKRKYIVKNEIIKSAKYKLDFLTNNCNDIFRYFEYKHDKNLFVDYTGISDNELLESFKYCCKHSFLPSIINETNSFYEIEYLDISEWRNVTAYERSTPIYFNAVDKYCSYIHDLKFCIALDPHDNNIMINRNTGQIKNIDLEDIFPVSLFIPGKCILESDVPRYAVIMTNYIWSARRFNKSFEYYKDLLGILLYVWDMHNVDIYENKTDILSKKIVI
jgi:hypothetical protein